LKKNQLQKKNVSTLRTTAPTFASSKTIKMKTLVDSILIQRIQMESNTTDVVLNCIVYEAGMDYASDIILSSHAMNLLLNELAYRGHVLDFDAACDEVCFPDGHTMYSLDVAKNEDHPVFIPLYSLPEKTMLLRA
jgi:hypothetical protein